MATMPLGENYYNWSHGKKTRVATGGWGGVIFARGCLLLPPGALVTQRLFLWVVAFSFEREAGLRFYCQPFCF